MLTHDRLTELLSYDPATGRFVWLQARSRVRPGEEAGHVSAKTPRGHGYRRIHIDGREYMAHRLAWLFVKRCWPVAEIDHVNGQKTDNRFSNLREASRSENARNVGRMRVNKSGFKGVHWEDRYGGRWRASIKVRGRQQHLGYFADVGEAAAAYRAAALDTFGSFACVE